MIVSAQNTPTPVGVYGDTGGVPYSPTCDRIPVSPMLPFLRACGRVVMGAFRPSLRRSSMRREFSSLTSRPVSAGRAFSGGGGMIVRGRELKHLSDTQRRVFWAIAHARYPITANEIADKVYAECEDGGPLAVPQNIGVHVSRVREKLLRSPYRIKSNLGGNGGYWLEVVE